MRRITLVRISSYFLGLLCLIAFSARPSHAVCATSGLFNTPYLVFATQPVGQSGLTQTATLTFGTGCGNAAVVTINSITISGTNPGDFTEAGNGVTPCNTGTTLNIGPSVNASCTLGSTFTPAAAGTRTATITVNWSVVGGGVNDGPVTLNLVGGDEIVYVTTGSGGQVLTVDGAAGAFEVLSNGPGSAFNPTGAVVGPDGKIYVTDQTNSNIWRMNQDGSQLEAVYSGGPSCVAPCSPEGPSFSGSGTGDLYFNTFGTGNGSFVILDVATTPFGGPFNTPVLIEPCNPGVNDQNCPLGGAGTAFDANGNLLAADQENADIWSLPPPYTSQIAPTAILNSSSASVGVNVPTGIALNKASGQVYFANSDSAQQILQIVPPAVPTAPYTTTAYYTFTTTSCNLSDFPDYMQFDMTGHLFVTTSNSPQPGGANNCGKVWRIDPGPTATLLLDLNAVQGSGIAGVCAAGECGLNGTQAVGVAIPPTSSLTQTVGLTSTAGSATVGFPIGCTPTNTPGNNCSSTIGIQYPAGMFGAGDTLNVTFNETTQTQFMVNTAGTPYAATTLAPVSGYNGGGLVPTLTCTNGGVACSDINTSSTYNIFTTWQTIQTNYCTLIPHLLKGDPPGGPYNQLLIDTIVNCTDGAAGTKGQSSCTKSTTSSSQCLSDWPNAFGAVTGSTAGVTAAGTIAAPTSGANFLLNQPETATFACPQSPTSPTIVLSCPGVVTQPNGTIASVASGGSLPTSQAGTYTLSVTPNVDGGSGVTSAAAQYNVLPCQDVSLAFNPNSVVEGKSTTVTASLRSCTSSAEIAVIQFTLTGPFGRNCGMSQTLVLAVPAILGPTPVNFKFSLKIPNGACAGTYTVSSATYVKGAIVSTSSSSLTVTAH